MLNSSNTQPPVQDSGLTIQLEKIVDFNPTGVLPTPRIQEVIDPVDGVVRLYATDPLGVISIIENGNLLPEPFLDLRDRSDFFTDGLEGGIRSVAFHPDFQTPGTAGFGKIYTSYTAPVASREGATVFESSPELPGPLFDSVVAEWTLFDPFNPLSVDPDSKRELFRNEQPFRSHNISTVTFNPAAEPGDFDYGKLYISVGDGGVGRGPDGFLPGAQSQDLSLLAGSVLRIDPLQQNDEAAYGIPSNNPFINVPGALPEIWAFGFRNPQVLAFGANGGLFSSDVGEDSFEEINFIVRGGNYGWNDREGPLVLVDNGPVRLAETPADVDGFQFPFSGYDRQEIRSNDPFGAPNAAISGGYVYSGDDIPELLGLSVFTDFSRAQAFAAPI